jgi:hypothetical protein
MRPWSVNWRRQQVAGTVSTPAQAHAARGTPQLHVRCKCQRVCTVVSILNARSAYWTGMCSCLCLCRPVLGLAVLRRLVCHVVDTDAVIEDACNAKLAHSLTMWADSEDLKGLCS